MKNYTKEQHQEGFELERVFAVSFKDQVTWNNRDWDQVTKYDGIKDSGDFTVTGTETKLELQKHNSDWKQIYIPFRRLYEVDNVKGSYGPQKDVSKTWLVLFDGSNTYVIHLNKLQNYKIVSEGPMKRVDWEKWFVLPLSEFKKVTFSSFCICVQAGIA